MLDLLAKADAFEKEPGIDVVSIQVGFTWSDIPYTGPSIAVSHEPARRGARPGDRARADRRDLAAARRRGCDLLSADRRRHRRGARRRRQEGTAGHRRRHRQSGRRRLQRHDARPAGAARRRHRERGLRHDLRSRRRCSRRSRRASARRSTSAWAAIPIASMGKPVKAKAVVKMLSDGIFKNDGPMNAGVETSMGPTAVLRIGGIDVVTISSRIQTIDLQVFLSQGIDPDGQERAGGEERAAFPRRLRADRARDRAGRFGRHLLARHHAAEVHQAAPADLAARRRQRSLCGTRSRA